MNKCNFIKTSDYETFQKLKNCGFNCIGEANGIWVFLNNTNMMFDGDEKKVIYTNKIEL